MERKQSNDSSEIEKGTQSRADGLQVENSLLQNRSGPVMNEKDPNEVAVDAFVVDENDKTKINYKNMGWVKAGALISAETIALGILSFPSVFHRLGMATGILLTVLLAATSWYTGYILVQFKVNHPGVMNFGDAGRIVAGKSGAIVMGVLLMLKVVLVAASHSLSGGIALSNISDYKICSLAYAAIITFVSFVLCIPRTFERISWISFISVSSVLIACVITIVASGLQSLETLQAATGKNLGPVQWYASEHHELIDVVNALTNILFAYGGHVAIFSFASEMREPKEFTKSLALVQVLSTSWYILVGATIYSFSGQYVTSPALSGTVDAVRITAYAIALISIIVAGVVASLVAGKYVWLQMFKGTETLTSASMKAWSIWILIMGSIWTAAFILQALIPFFNNLLSIISSLATVWFTYGLSSVMWFNMNSSKNSEVLRWTSGPGGWFSSPSKAALAICNIIIFVCTAGIMGLGLYSAIQGIIDGYNEGTYSHPFACASP